MSPSRAAFAAAALALAGCWRPSWRGISPGEKPTADVVVLVGRFASVPPIEQYSGRPTNVVLPGSYKGNVAALFTESLDEPWRHAPMSWPLERFESAWMPLDGWFFIEVPRKAALYLRGFVYASDTGGVRFEAPARIPIRPSDRVVYVGELTAVRSGEEKLLCRSRPADARKAAEDAGQAGLLAVPWTTRLAEPVAGTR